MSARKLLKAVDERLELRFDSLHRFKELEADCVILCYVDPGAKKSAHLVYVGASRARSLLYVLRS